MHPTADTAKLTSSLSADDPSLAEFLVHFTYEYFRALSVASESGARNSDGETLGAENTERALRQVDAGGERHSPDVIHFSRARRLVHEDPRIKEGRDQA